MGLAKRTDDRATHLIVETDGLHYWAVGVRPDYGQAKAEAAKVRPEDFRRIVVRVDADVIRGMGIK